MGPGGPPSKIHPLCGALFFLKAVFTGAQFVNAKTNLCVEAELRC